MKIAIITVSAVLGLALLLFLGAYITFRMTFYSDRRKKTDPFWGLEGELTEKKQVSREIIEKLLAIEDFEEIKIKSLDGLTLSARYYHKSDTGPLEIHFHGYKSVSLRDMSGGALECLGRGHNLLLCDHRAHGESEGSVISFGVKERYDVLVWCRYAAKRFGYGKKILLFGISMGAATILSASSLPLPENVVGMIADCPYSSAKKIISHVMRGMHFPPSIFYPLVRLGAILFGAFDPNKFPPAEEVKSARIPILLIHGEGDDFVPPEMSLEILENTDAAKLITFPEAGHGLSYIFDRDGYINAVSEFEKDLIN